MNFTGGCQDLGDHPPHHLHLLGEAMLIPEHTVGQQDPPEHIHRHGCLEAGEEELTSAVSQPHGLPTLLPFPAPGVRMIKPI